MQQPKVQEEQHLGPRSYVVIGLILGVITIVEVGAFYLDITAWLLVMVMLLLSASKFVLVVGLFMHLRFDDRRFLALFGVPLVIALSVFVALIGVFQNTSPYMRGLFSSGEDRLGDQAKTILKTHLSQSGRFDLFDRDNMEEIAREANISGSEQQLLAAEVIVTGQVTEFGRRTTGDRQLFGILGRGKQQVAYCVVSINLVDVSTSRVIHSVQGAGEYALSDREIIGFGGTSGYDSTLNGKVLNLAIMEAVDRMVQNLEAGLWNP